MNDGNDKPKAKKRKRGGDMEDKGDDDEDGDDDDYVLVGEDDDEEDDGSGGAKIGSKKSNKKKSSSSSSSSSKKNKKKKKQPKKSAVVIDPIAACKNRIKSLTLVVHPPVFYNGPNKCEYKIESKKKEVLNMQMAVGDDDAPPANLLGDVQNAIATRILGDPNRGAFLPYKGQIGPHSAVYLSKTGTFTNPIAMESSDVLWQKICEAAGKRESSKCRHCCCYA